MDVEYIATHASEEEHHWWFIGRRAVILGVARELFGRGGHRLAEIGCGTGSLLDALSEFGEVIGVEASAEFLRVARRHGRSVRFGALPDAVPLPPGSMDGVLLLDVLEHIEDDRKALAAVRDLLRPGGLLLCTVPAYQVLWSAHDVVLGHRRRYTAAGLRSLLGSVGLQATRVTYFNAFLAPPIAVVRLLGRRWRSRHHDLVPFPQWLNGLFARLFAFEAVLLRRVNFPFGISLLAVARHPDPVDPQIRRHASSA
jgi:SAM-dependent methyltransferase